LPCCNGGCHRVLHAAWLTGILTTLLLIYPSILLSRLFQAYGAVFLQSLPGLGTTEEDRTNGQTAEGRGQGHAGETPSLQLGLVAGSPFGGNLFRAGCLKN